MNYNFLRLILLKTPYQAKISGTNLDGYTLMTFTSNPLSDDELDQLEDFLFSDHVSEDCLDLIGTHGLFCALNISPQPLPEEERHALVFDEEPQWNNAEQKQQITELLRRFYREISGNLYSDGEIELPCELSLDPEDEDDLAPLACWAQAFMEGVFAQEDSWFGHPSEQDVAEMLLPIMVASELFEEDEISRIRDDENLCAEMCSQIPELLIDLYLLFHAPEK